MKIPDGWRFDGVCERKDGGDGCPYFERLARPAPGDPIGFYWQEGEDGIYYTEDYRKACVLVAQGIMGAGDLPGECAGCPSRPS